MYSKVMPCEMCPTCQYYHPPGGLNIAHGCNNDQKYKKDFFGRFLEVTTTEMNCAYYESK